jgi:hypothetical protein
VQQRAGNSAGPLLNGQRGLHVLRPERDGDLGVLGDLYNLGQLNGQPGGLLQVGDRQNSHSGSGDQDLALVHAGALDSNGYDTRLGCAAVCLRSGPPELRRNVEIDLRRHRRESVVKLASTFYDVLTYVASSTYVSIVKRRCSSLR